MQRFGLSRATPRDGPYATLRVQSPTFPEVRCGEFYVRLPGLRADDGQIEVKNRCKLADGKYEEVIGAAKLAPRNDDDKSNAVLKVRFAPVWLSWLPQVWGDYWVIDLDPDYQYAVVSEPSRKFLWILSRTPAMEPLKYEALLAKIKAAGFDTAKLVVDRAK